MPLSSLSDEAIIKQIKEDNNPVLIEELVRRYQTKVVSHCYRYIKDLDEAKDLSQDIFLRVSLKIQDFKSESSFSTWLHTIVHNHCSDHLKKDKKSLYVKISRYITETIEEEYNTEELEKPIEEILAEFISEITEEERVLFTLKYQQDWSIKEIQGFLKISESNVKIRLHRLKKKLQKKMCNTRYE